MTNSRKSEEKAVGYVRLSTEKQAWDDENFEKQARRIREACKRRGFELCGIFDDVGSGADPLGAVRRDGLKGAVSRARLEGAVLIVTEPTRLFRNVEAARDFFSGLDVRVFSVRDGRFMKAPALLRAIEHGEALVHAVRTGTQQTAAKKKEAGQEFCEPSVRSKAAKISAEIRTRKAEKIAMQVAHVLRSDPAYADLSNRALADLLNRRNIMTGWRRKWTPNSAKHIRKKANEFIDMMTEIDNADDALAVPAITTAPGSLVGAYDSNQQSSARTTEGAVSPAKQEMEADPPELSEDDKLRQLPNFGMF